MVTVTFSVRFPLFEVTVASKTCLLPPVSANLVALKSRSLSIRFWTPELSIVLEPDIHLSPSLV